MMKRTLHNLLMADHLLFQKTLFSNIKDSGLTLGQPKILDHLLYNDGIVQKDLADACHIEPATMTSVLLGMENNGLIYRQNRHGNRRSLYVYLTPKGKEAAIHLEAEFTAIEERALRGFSAEETEQLLSFLERIRTNMSRKEVAKDE